MSGVAHLRGDGVSLLLDARGDGLPRIAHWGAEVDDLGVADASIPPVARAAAAVPMAVALLPLAANAHRGRPGLTGGPPFSPRFVVTGVEVQDAPRSPLARGQEAGSRVAVRASDAGLELRSELRLGSTGVLELRHALRNVGPEPYSLEQLACVLPVPPVAREVLDLSGHWCRERHPQRRVPGLGTWLRESRRGRTGFDANLLMVAGTPGFGFRSGEVWGIHLAWSGDAASWAERLPDGTSVLGAAELLRPGEVVLEPGDEYVTPWLYGAWSGRGLDGLSAALHAWERARPSHPRSPRPVVLNTWEAVYFDHRLDRLTGLADTAASLGVERFVLDDGWFRGRRDDTAGLGDWYVDEDVWPDGLHPLIAHVCGLGMQFGLWVEPEMVNPDSDLFRAHPEWVLQPGSGRLPVSWRGQQVLDLGHEGAFACILERLDALLSEYEIGYLKWDHNRDLVEAGHEGRPGVHRQTLAVYRLLDELRARHPALEIESCSSGGARADLGILARTDRIWASDTNDALERQAIQRWTGLLLAPELVGAHIGPPRAHTTGRMHDLSFRVATALFGHFGIEWDVTSTSEDERAGLAEAIAFYKRMRGVLHGGEVVRADHHDPAAYLHGVVAADRSEALFAYVQLATSALEVPGAGRFDGLDPKRAYRVEPVLLAGGPRFAHVEPPPWLTEGAITLSGRALAVSGLQLPALAPEQALLLHLTVH